MSILVTGSAYYNWSNISIFAVLGRELFSVITKDNYSKK